MGGRGQGQSEGWGQGALFLQTGGRQPAGYAVTSGTKTELGMPDSYCINPYIVHIMGRL